MGREAIVAAVRRENTLPIEKRALGARGDEDEDDEDDDDEVMAEVLIGGGSSRLEQQNPLDPPSLRKAKQRRDPTEPTAAFGPPGSSGELNISCVVAPIEAGFALRSLGQPEEAGNLILRAFIAPLT